MTITLERLAPLTGAVFAVLAVLAAVLVNNYSYLPPEREIQTFFIDNSTTVQVAGYLGALSAAFLIWFAGRVRSGLRPIEGGTGRLSAVAFGGGAVAGGLIAVAFAILIAGAARGGAEAGINGATAAAIYDIYGSIVGLAVPMTFGVFIGATTLVAIREKMWPAWLAWASAIIAVGSLSPLSYVFVGFDVLWVLVFSIGLYVTQPAVDTTA